MGPQQDVRPAKSRPGFTVLGRNSLEDPYVQLGFLENIECPLNNKQMLSYYYKLALESNILEGKLVMDYGCVVPIEPFLEWDVNKEHHVIKESVDESTVDTHVEGFESQWKRAD